MGTPDEREAAPHLLVVIDHHKARVYRTEVHGAVPVRVVPSFIATLGRANRLAINDRHAGRRLLAALLADSAA